MPEKQQELTTQEAADTSLINIEVSDELLDQVDGVLAECNQEALEHLKPVKRSLVLAAGLNQLRKLVDGKFLKEITALQGSSLGFRTDKDDAKDKYPPAVVRDCAIEAMLRGSNLFGNEWNIIAARCYLTKEFYERKLSELEGFANLKVHRGVPLQSRDGAYAFVPMRASWTMDGQADALNCLKTEQDDERIVVKVNKGMGFDAMLGKAEKRLYKRIYQIATGRSIEDGDGDEEVPTVNDQPPVAAEAATDAEFEESPPEKPWDNLRELGEEVARATLGCDAKGVLLVGDHYYGLATTEDEKTTIADVLQSRQEQLAKREKVKS